MNDPANHPGAVPFSFPIRVYYENTDAGGVVYHAEYLRFFERARTEWLRGMGIAQSDLRDQSNVLFAVRSMNIEYIRPARLDNELVVSVECQRVRQASLIIDQEMRNAVSDELLATAQVRVAVISADGFKPTAAPDYVLEQIRTTTRKTNS